MAEKETHKLYNGEIEIIFYPNSHRYVLASTGEILVSSTSVTGLIDKSRVLIKWALNLARDFLITLLTEGRVLTKADIEEAAVQHEIRKQEAADTGTQVHKWAENHVKSKMAGEPDPELPTEPQVLNGVLAYLKWEEQHHVVYKKSEFVVYSKTHRFVGTGDCLAEVDGVLSMVDFKTSKGIYPEMYLQVSSYRGAVSEELGLDIKQSILLNFGKETGEFSVHFTEDHDEDYAAFLGLLVAKRRLKILDKWA